MIRRILFGLFWFAIIWMGLLVAGLGLTGALQVRPEPTMGEGFSSSYEVGVEAGAKFRERYGWIVITVAGLLAAGGSIAGILPGTRK